jgi:hypothetical protein
MWVRRDPGHLHPSNAGRLRRLVVVVLDQTPGGVVTVVDRAFDQRIGVVAPNARVVVGAAALPDAEDDVDDAGRAEALAVQRSLGEAQPTGLTPPVASSSATTDSSSSSSVDFTRPQTPLSTRDSVHTHDQERLARSRYVRREVATARGKRRSRPAPDRDRSPQAQTCARTGQSSTSLMMAVPDSWTTPTSGALARACSSVSKNV